MRPLLALAFAFAFLAPPASATPPNACEILTPAEISTISERKVERIRPHKTGNPSECGFVDSRNAVVMVLALKEVQYAVKDELENERSQMEKIYRTKAKPVDTVGDAGYWINRQLWFRKGKIIGSVKFETAKNQNEVDTAQVARLVEAKLK